MKKVLSLILALCMLLACCALAEFDDGTVYEPALANSIDVSADEWFSTGENRALLTVLLGLEITSADGSYGLSDFVGDSYVGLNDDTLFVVMCGDAKDLIMVYQPSIGTAIYNFTDASGSANVDAALAETCADGHYLNSVDELIAVSEQILELIGD